MIDERAQPSEFDLGAQSNLGQSISAVAVDFSAQPRLLFHGRIDPPAEPFAEQSGLVVVEPPLGGGLAHLPAGLGKESAGDRCAVPAQLASSICVPQLMRVEGVFERRVALV